MIAAVTNIKDDACELPSEIVLHDTDRPVLAAALCCCADVLLTGDTTHFGHLMNQPDQVGIRITTVRDFLLH